MIIKLAFRNLVRMPWRTVLYFLVVFFLVVAVTASVFVYTAFSGGEKGPAPASFSWESRFCK